MKGLLSKELYCYKIHTSLMKTSTYLLLYRQPPPPTPPPFLQKNLDPPWKIFYKNPNCHISKGEGDGKMGEGGHTMNITYDLLKQSYNGEMDGGYIWVWSTIQTSKKQNGGNRKDFKQ